MTISKILIPIDGSERGNIALEYGIYFAKRLHAELVGFHVIDLRVVQGPVFTDISGSIGLPPYQDFLPLMQSSLDERAEAILKAFLARFEKAGLHPETRKVLGIVDNAIIEEGKNADCILLPQRGEHLQLGSSNILGSTVESVIRRSGKPVIVTPATFIEVESMGLAYDGSGPAQNALTIARELSENASWPLSVIIITDDHSVGAHLTKEVENYLEPFNIDCEIIVLRGKEDREILRFIEEGSIELMVMGAYGHNRLRELILGSTTSSVIRKSTIPVLLTR